MCFEKKGARTEKKNHTAIELFARCDMLSCNFGQVGFSVVVERLNRGIRHRTRVMGTFRSGNGTLRLVAVGLKYVADSE